MCELTERIMDIKIRSNFQFCEGIYDKAFGLAKKIIMDGRDSRVRRTSEYVLTAKRTKESVVVTIHSST